MKHKRFIIYSFIFLLFHWSVEAQTEKGKITIQLHEVTLSRIIEEVEKQTDYTFFINDSRIDIHKKVSISVTNAELKEVLDKTVSTAGYDYSIVEKQILISHRPVVEESSRLLTGTITDELGEPITGATIQVKNTTNGTISDIDGHFSISIPNDKAVLLISYLGFKSIEIANIGNRSNLLITMEEDSRQLNEVVIIGYGVQSKKNTDRSGFCRQIR